MLQLATSNRILPCKKRYSISTLSAFVYTIIYLGLSGSVAAFPSEKGGDGWTVELGFGGEWESQFAGSNNRQFEPAPYLSFAYRKQKTIWYTSLIDYGVYHSLDRQWVVGTSLGLEVGRDEDDDAALVGLGQIDDTWELRFDVAYRLSDDWNLAARVMTAGADKDNVYFLAALYDFPLDSERFELSLRSDLSWGSGKHLRTEFGVSPEQAENSGYSIHQPNGGFKSIGTALSGKYRLNKSWFGYGEFSYERYGKAGSNSPFADNDYDIEGEIGIGYRF